MMRSSSSSVRPWDEPSRLTVFMGDLAPRSREQWEDELEYDEEDWLEIIAQVPSHPSACITIFCLLADTGLD
jgi:hypothetical protein